MSSRSTASPDHPYEFFIDECVAARPVAAMLLAHGHPAHVQYDTFGSGTPDLEWLPKVGARGWILITKDKQIRKREIELHALRQARVRAFVLTAAGLTGDEQARVLERALPAMLRLLRRQAATFVARVTAGSHVEIIEWHKNVRD